jgi:hypothetical protein
MNLVNRIEINRKVNLERSHLSAHKHLLSKLRLMVALLSPSSFFAVTLYFPASSTVTFFISRAEKYEWPSFSTVICKQKPYKKTWIECRNACHQKTKILFEEKETWPSANFYGTSKKKIGILTRCLAESCTNTPPWYQVTVGFGSAWIRHSNKSRFPSSSCLMAGFLAKVGAIPSICLQCIQHFRDTVISVKFILVIASCKKARFNSGHIITFKFRTRRFLLQLVATSFIVYYYCIDFYNILQKSSSGWTWTVCNKRQWRCLMMFCWHKTFIWDFLALLRSFKLGLPSLNIFIKFKKLFWARTGDHITLF